MLNAIIVDDEAPARSELRFLLDEAGVELKSSAEAANVREAIEKLKEYPCDVMFMDVNMPEATGLQLAEALQHLKFPPAVVFVTAYTEHALASPSRSAPSTTWSSRSRPSALARPSPACASRWPLHAAGSQVRAHPG